MGQSSVGLGSRERSGTASPTRISNTCDPTLLICKHAKNPPSSHERYYASSTTIIIMSEFKPINVRRHCLSKEQLTILNGQSFQLIIKFFVRPEQRLYPCFSCWIMLFLTAATDYALEKNLFYVMSVFFV